MSESKNNKHVWPDEIRLEMIEKSNFYQEPRIYQYGYYDGYQKSRKHSKSSEMLDALKDVLELLEKNQCDAKFYTRGHYLRLSELIKEASKS